MPDDSTPDQLLTPSQAAEYFHVNPKTITRWARSGRITAIRTLGGHRRFRLSDIEAALERMMERSDTDV